MKIIELLTKEQDSLIDKLIKSYSKNNEFEVSVFSSKETSSEQLTLERFNNLNSVLSVVTKKNQEKYAKKEETLLDINMMVGDKTMEEDSKTNYRISINNLDKINEYMSMMHMRKNHLVFGVLVGFIMDKSVDEKDKKHISIMKKTKNFGNYVVVEEIYSKFKLDFEESLSEDEMKKLLKVNKNFDMNSYDIIYRFKERSSYFIVKGDNVFRIDLTKVRTSNLINNIENSQYRYEIEIESEIKDKGKFLSQLFDVIEFVIKCIQGTNHIVTKSMSNAVLNEYRDILDINKFKTNLYARQPISLEVQHVVDSLPNKYAVTDKADGDRYFMLVFDGRCYLISTNLVVRDTGIDIDKKYNKTIVDGEFIFLPTYNRYLYMGFDCLTVGDKNMRDEANLFVRLAALDEVVDEINKTKYKHKKNSNIDFNDIEKLKQQHVKNITDFFDDISKELESKSTKIIFRRKYFIESNGIKDNEIFKYSELLWNTYTINSKIKCPYELDGLIYQPLDQKYIIEVEKIKYFDYKWKPPSHNSIDFYVEFEKDKNSGKILKIYDNSIEGVVKNKPYVILNLFAGNSNKGIEKPMLFGIKEGISQCYLYLDDNGIPRSEDGRQLNDKTVIEFYYKTDGDYQKPYRWIPIKTRYDKTESVQKFQRRYGNSYVTAQKVWNTIVNPVLMSDFATLSDDKLYNQYFKKMQERIDFNLLNLEKKQNIYYQQKSDLVKNMGQFNNWVKSNVIYTYCNAKSYDGIQLKVLDIGCGRGGDIQKWYYCEVEMYTGFDPDLEGLTNATDGAITRYNQQKARHDRFFPAYFALGTGSALLQYEEQLKALGRLRPDDKKVYDKILTWNDKRTIFDRANFSYSIHYMLSDENSFNNLLENLNRYLRDGGLIMFCTFDGEVVKEKLKGKDRLIEYYDDNGEKKVLYEIVKRYDDDSKDKLGLAIDVHMSWISEEGVYITEYLVLPDFIIKTLRDRCSLELVETLSFKELFDNNREYLKTASKYEVDKEKKFYSNVYEFYKNTDFNKKCQEYSFLSKYYVFRKTESDLNKVKREYYGSDRRRIFGKKKILK
jgi:SAM-dependent methyltransferase